jgi:hypothetical protein
LISKSFLLFSLSTLFSVASYANTDQIAKKTTTLPRSEIFPPKGGKLIPLQGKILNGRYYGPNDIFSCQADHFGNGIYFAQDGFESKVPCAMIGFYSPRASFKRAEVMFLPGLKEKNLEKEALKDLFNSFGIEILKIVDNAESIEILREEMVEGAFFSAISVKKISVLRHPNGKYLSSTRGYLVFQHKDKLVVLTNQIATLPGHKHDPKKHAKKLKKEILDFRKTFEFSSKPSSTILKEKSVFETAIDVTQIKAKNSV